MANLKWKLKRTFLNVAAPFSREAEREGARMDAREMFEMARAYAAERPQACEIALGITQDCLKLAGEDTETDKPYQDILEIVGGKTTFDAMLKNAQEDGKKQYEEVLQRFKGRKPQA
ncbi:MAG: hypothetical protein EA357_09300 [Micavibrio sp.]|nr:MAG: hypothetical protein EA357_09300 [Micavibrio sp.]